MIIDMHTHILPGVDDGAKDWDICLEMLSQSAACGVEKVIATPHYGPWGKRVPAEKIRELCKEAEEKLRAQYGIAMDIHSGHEIYYSVEVIEDLKQGRILTLAGSRHVLVEFEPEVTYQVIYRAIREFTNDGYIPIVAHVERYQCLYKSGNLERLKEGGALVQMNVSAFQGGILDATSRWAKKCLRSGLIDFLASDMHNLRTRAPLTMEKLRWVQDKLEPQYQEKLLCGNCQKIIADIKQ